MGETADLSATQSLLSRMVDAITAAQEQTPWPAAELAELAEEVWAEGRLQRVWALG